ncbi:hypothetical protein ACOMHN_015491 [Nucella lapillus]
MLYDYDGVDVHWFSPAFGQPLPTEVPLGVMSPWIVTSSDGSTFGDDVSTEGDVSSEGERTDVGVTLQWTDCTRGLKAGQCG